MFLIAKYAHARFLAAAMAVVALALVGAACGGGGDDDEPTATVAAPTEVAEDETPDAEVTAETATVDIDRTFWHAGWKVTLGTATLEEGTALSIEAEFENLGDDEATFDSQLVLQSSGNTYTDSTFDQEFPRVPGALKGNGLITFRVDDEFDLDDAVLTIGNPSNNQAVVPFAADDAGYVSLEPQAVEVTGSVTAGALTITIEGAEVRADLPDRHSEVEESKKAITIRFSAMPSTGIAIGQGVLFSENVILKLPDGTAVAVISDGVSGVNELLQGREGTTIPDLKVRYEIPDPVAGQYAIVLRGNYGPGGAQVEGELPFTIPAVGDGVAATPAAAATP